MVRDSLHYQKEVQNHVARGFPSLETILLYLTYEICADQIKEKEKEKRTRNDAGVWRLILNVFCVLILKKHYNTCSSNTVVFIFSAKEIYYSFDKD